MVVFERESALRRVLRGICQCGRLKVAISQFCQACALARRHRSLSHLPRICAHCGQSFTRSNRKISRYCSVKCVGVAKRLPATVSIERRRVRRRKATAKRVAAGWVSGRVGRWMVVCERDGWVCWVCNGQIDKSLSQPNRLAGTVDHVIALIHGGSDDDDNVRAAHFTCNIRRFKTAAPLSPQVGVMRGV